MTTATMTDTFLHPWLTTPEAMRAAEAATLGVFNMAAATGLEHDEVMSMALRLLCECALSDDMSRTGVGRRASELPGGHAGNMWTWPQDQMGYYAAREVLMALRHELRMRRYRARKAEESAGRIATELAGLRS